ncbi:MAG: hypothetical protein OXT69_11610 [Candidatus Poribacteria bacterium]|nr:hypothetical protein [Candidatus Poribacteria bacterium]
MYDEPRRWIQALENRVQYVEKRLRSGSPVVGLPYNNGALLFTMRPRGQQKVYEVYDRLAMGALGHPADVERLRMIAVNLAHVEGFARSADDVTLQRLLHFTIAPQIKQAFDEIYRSPFIAKCLMAELAPKAEQTQFFTVNFDGNFSSHDRFGAAAGTQDAEETALHAMESRLSESPGLEESLRCAVYAWGASFDAAFNEADDDRIEERPPPSDDAVGAALAKAAERLLPEAAVLDHTLSGKAKYRKLTKEELRVVEEAAEKLRPKENGQDR